MMKKIMMSVLFGSFVMSGCVVARPGAVYVGPRAKRCSWVKKPGKAAKRVCVRKNRRGVMVRTR